MHTTDRTSSLCATTARRVLPFAAAACAVILVGSESIAQSARPLSPNTNEPVELTIDEKLGETAPLDVQLKDHLGNDVTLNDYFNDGKPVIITPIYFRCPLLCSLTLNGLLTAMEELELTAGEDFHVLTFSFNPDEGPELAKVKRQAYLSVYKRDAAENGWHFLTGQRDQIEALCDGIGFQYDYNEETGEYIHPPAAIFVTADGRISRYMSDVMFAPRDVRLALIEASEGSIGSPMERFALRLCYQYDPDTNSYVASAWKIMRLGGAATVVLLVSVLGTLFYLDYRKARHIRGSDEASGSPSAATPAIDGSST